MTMRQGAVSRRMVVTLGLVGMLSGCADTLVKTLGPENQAILSTTTDAFRYQAWDLDNVHDKVVARWRNTTATAAVLHRNFIHHGQAVLTITDANGQLIHQSPLEWETDLETNPGTPGMWTATIQFYGAKGRVDVQLNAIK